MTQPGPASAAGESLDTSTIRDALEREDYDTVISEVRAAMAADPIAALGDPVINDWMGRRYRNIFISEAVADPTALKHSQAPFPIRLIDPRNDRERVAKRMIRRISDDEITVEMPRASATSLTNTTLIFAPGLITGLMPSLGFQFLWPGITERFGLRVLASDSHPMRSSDANVADLENAIERGIGIGTTRDAPYITAADNPVPPGDVLLMGYSKGSPDILSLLTARPDLAPRIRGFIGWAGAVGGSYIADDIYKQIKDIPAFQNGPDAPERVMRQVLRLVPIAEVKQISRRLDEYDIAGAIQSLTTPFRAKFLEENAEAINALGIPMFYFTGSTTVFEVPYFQKQGTLELKQYDRDNDMQLTQEQARVPHPSAPHLAMFHANHWDLSYDTFPWVKTMGSMHLREPFARGPALAAIVLFMAEIGLLD